MTLNNKVLKALWEKEEISLPAISSFPLVLSTNAKTEKLSVHQLMPFFMTLRNKTFEDIVGEKKI